MRGRRRLTGTLGGGMGVNPDDASSKLAADTVPRVNEGYTPEKRELYPPPHPLLVIEEEEGDPEEKLLKEDEIPRVAMSETPFKLGGKLRVLPQDFIVEEVWENRVCDINQPLSTHVGDQGNSTLQEPKDYLHFTLVKHNWDTIRALNYIRRKIGVSLKRFGFAGMKDKRAVTAQRVSLWKGRADVLAHLKLHEMFLKEFEYADERINLGNAVGNRFTINRGHVESLWAGSYVSRRSQLLRPPETGGGKRGGGKSHKGRRSQAWS
jgi:hypothetical protein